MPTAKPSTPHMSGDEFLAAVRKLGFAGSGKANDLGLSAVARFFDYDPRTARTWAVEGPPAAVAIALKLMLAHRLNAESAAALLARRR